MWEEVALLEMSRNGSPAVAEVFEDVRRVLQVEEIEESREGEADFGHRVLLVGEAAVCNEARVRVQHGFANGREGVRSVRNESHANHLGSEIDRVRFQEEAFRVSEGDCGVVAASIG